MKVNKLSEIITYYQNFCLTGKHTYQNRAKHLLYFDSMPFDTIKRTHVRQYAKTRSKSVTYATINREISFARAAINAYAFDYELNMTNPFANIKYTEADTIPRYLTQSEVERLLTACHTMNNQNLHDYLSLLVYTGSRPIELLTLTWDNVHLDKRHYIVRNCYSKTKRTLYKYLNDTALQVLANRERVGDFVFTNVKTGERYYDFKNQFKTCKKLAGVNCRMYDLRHTYASWLVQSGVSIYTVKNLLGHRDISTTERYAHLDYDSYLQALNKIG